MPPKPSSPCPCGRPIRYELCCGRWHDGGDGAAPDAESLMRSRYSAYVLGLDDYLRATWHVSTRPETIESRQPGLKWLGLEVRRAWLVDPALAYVEFVARSRLVFKGQRLHETSRFVFEAGRWWYVDGEFAQGGGH
jgi:SEC-C motif-containing protein